MLNCCKIELLNSIVDIVNITVSRHLMIYQELKMVNRIFFAGFTVFLLFTSGLSNAASSEFIGDYGCERLQFSTTGFNSKKAAESWFPEYLEISVSENKARMYDFSSSDVIFRKTKVEINFVIEKNTLKFEVRPTGKSYLTILAKSGFFQTSPATYKCEKVNFSRTANNQVNSSSEVSSEGISSLKLDKAAVTCSELGFKAGTEKHGDCVLKLLDQ